MLVSCGSSLAKHPALHSLGGGGGGAVTWPKKHRKCYAPKAPKKVYKALKLIYTVIFWYSFVVQSPPTPPGRGNRHFMTPPPFGGDRHDKGGEISKGGRVPNISFDLKGHVPQCGFPSSSFFFVDTQLADQCFFSDRTTPKPNHRMGPSRAHQVITVTIQNPPK